MLIALILGIAFGFVSAIPVAGPISALIFSKGMKGRYSQGRWIAAGAALIESAYTFLAFWSFNHFLARLSSMFIISNAVAAALMAYLGIYFFRSQKMRKPVTQIKREDASSRAGKSFLIGAGICAVNPSLIATWTAFITTLFSMNFFEFTNTTAILFSSGVCLGIFIWFNLQLKLIKRFRDQLNESVLDKVLKGIGCLLIFLSLLMMYRLLGQLHLI